MLLTVCPVAVFAADGGDGSTDDLPSSAIAISSVDELAMICNEYPADGYYYLTGDLDLTYAVGEYGDYYNDGQGWEPIGNRYTPFKGTFDGRGYTVKGLNINRPNQSYIGLFGYASGATIKNCKLKIAEIKGLDNVGGFLGIGLSTVLSACETLSGVIEAHHRSDAQYGTVYANVGGIVGTNSGSILNCKNACTVSAYASASIANSFAGGIAGASQHNISNCINEGKVTSEAYSSTYSMSHSFAGGIVGKYSGSKIMLCKNTAAVEANSRGDVFSAGIAVCESKNNESSVTQCINTGKSKVAIAYNCDVSNSYSFSAEARSFSASCSVKNCYSIPSFTAENGTVWLSDGSQVTRTNKQMRLKATYDGFDFENTWTMDGNHDYPYPELIESPSTFKKSLASISVAAPPDKVNYLEGKDEFDITGAILRLTYDNGTTEKIPMTAEMVSGFDNTVVGTNRIKVQYSGFETSFNVTVIARSLVSIAVGKQPNKTEYLEGKDEFDPAGGELKLSYNNDTTKTVDLKDASFSGFDNTTPGEQTVIVTYGGKTTTLKVNIIEKTLEKIEVTTLPSKTQYLEGKDKLSKDGGVITLYYNNGKTATVSLSDADVTGFNNRKVGTQTLTVHYMEKTAQFNVKIVAKSVSRISVASVPDTVTYLEGKDELSAAGGKINVFYNNDTEEEIGMTADMLSGFDCNTVGMQTVTVTYGGKTAMFEVEVIAKTLEKIEMLSLPAKKTYRERKDTLNLDGARINLIYNNGAVIPAAITAEMVSGFDNSVIGKQTITVTYQGKTTGFEIEIIAKTVMSISVSQKPSKLSYLEKKDELDVSGGVITVYYDNDTTALVPMTPDMVSGFDNTKVGTQVLTVTYLKKTTELEITIKQKTLVSEEFITEGAKTVYKEGESISTNGNLNGVYIRGRYDNGEYIDVSIPMLLVSGYDSHKVGKQTLAIEALGKVVYTFEITVVHDYVERVVPSTCSSNGYTEHVCQVCGYTEKDNYTDMKSHDLVHHDGKTATCTEKGYAEYDTCKNCDYTTFAETPALGHKEEKMSAVAPTCTKTGLTEGKRCSRCGKVLVPQKEVGKVAHKWDGGKVTKNAAVGVKGIKTFTCTVCRATRTEEIPALPKPQFKKGDVDLNGSISVADARLALRAAVGLDKLSGNAFLAADADGNGSISVADARMILRVAVGLEKFDD